MEHVLKRAQASYRQGFGQEKWLQIINVLLQCKVALRGQSNDVNDARRRMLAVVEKFGARYPVEVASLRFSIDKKLPDKKRNRIKVWASEKLEAWLQKDERSTNSILRMRDFSTPQELLFDIKPNP